MPTGTHAQTSSAPAPRPDPAPVRHGGSAWPGLGVSLVAALIALGAHRLVPALSPLMVGLALGILVAATGSVPAALEPGLKVSSRRVLRIGIVLLGLQLTLTSILDLGWTAVATVVTVVGVGILGTLWIGHLLGVPPMQRLLVACGFSICGAAAIAAVESTVDADEEDVASSIALVVVFGTLMTALTPLLLGAMTLGPRQQGLVTGASIHEVGQVVAAGGIIGGGALGVAVTVKLARVLLLAPVIVALGVWQRRTGSPATTRPPLVPLFVVGFLAACVLNTVADLPPVVLAAGAALQALTLSAAMFALGTSVRRELVARLGLAPLALGALSTALVLGIALAWVAVGA